MSIDDKLQQYLDTMLGDDLKCVWRQTYEDNQKGVGTTFGTEAPCRYCSGYDFDAPCYITGEQDEEDVQEH